MSNDFDGIPVVNSKKAAKEKPAELKKEELNVADDKVVGSDESIVKPKWSQEELLEVFDTLMFQGEYKETFTLRGKLSVTLKSRSVEETMKISREIDNVPYNLISTVQEHKALLNLSYSLVNYAGKDFSGSSQEEVYKYLGKLPIFILSTLVDKLSEFDSKVLAACKEAEENF